MEHIIIVAGLSPSNFECVEFLHLNAVVVGTATARLRPGEMMEHASQLQNLPATAGHWLRRSPGHADAGDIGENCRFLFTAVRATHFVSEPEILWESKWYDEEHLEHAVIVQYQAHKPMLGIGTRMRLMLCLCGEHCSAQEFRESGAIEKLQQHAIHGIVVLSNEDRSDIRDCGGSRDGAPSTAVDEALLADGVCFERHSAGGSD